MNKIDILREARLRGNKCLTKEDDCPIVIDNEHTEREQDDGTDIQHSDTDV